RGAARGFAAVRLRPDGADGPVDGVARDLRAGGSADARRGRPGGAACRDGPEGDEAMTRLRPVLAMGAIAVVGLIVWALMARDGGPRVLTGYIEGRSEEHTSELQSRENLVCRLLLE